MISLSGSAVMTAARHEFRLFDFFPSNPALDLGKRPQRRQGGLNHGSSFK